MADASSRIDIEGRSLRLTNAAKVLYPATGTTKADVLDYYLAVAERLVGQAWMRPATRKRWPNGVGTEQEPGESFFTKQLERGAPGWVATGTIEHQHRTVTYPLVNDRPTVAWLAQVAALEIHVPQWRFDDAGGHLPPDRLVLDLDPGPGAGLPECVEVAFTAKDLLEDMGLQVVPVTSGSKGLHLYAGLDGTQPTDQVNAFAREFARALEGLLPTLVVWEMKKSLRVGKVLVDWSQNNGNKTTVCPWSLRGRTRPMVAAPRSWDELADPGVAHLAMGEVLARLADGWEDPMAALAHAPDPPATEARTGPQTSGASDRLSAYRRMRDPGRTPEPVPTGVSGRPEQAAPSFVIQEHHASSLHYDLRIERDGVDLVITEQGIDTSTAVGRMFFQILGAVAEFERALLSERTRDGLAAARARGRTGGQQPKLTLEQAVMARGMYDETGPDGKRKWTVQQIATAFKVSRRTIYRHLETTGS